MEDECKEYLYTASPSIESWVFGDDASRRSLWVIGHSATLLKCEPWAALLAHAQTQRCLLRARFPYHHMMEASKESLLPDPGETNLFSEHKSSEH